MIESRNFLASQHLQGKKNQVAGWLTFKGDTWSVEINCGAKMHPLAYDSPCNDQLTNHFLCCCPQLLPPAFKISQLLVGIFLSAQQNRQMLELSMMGIQEEHSRQSPELQGDGRVSKKETLPVLIHPFLEFQQLQPACLSEPFLRYINTLTLNQEEIFLEDIKPQWQVKQSEVQRSTGGVVQV